MSTHADFIVYMKFEKLHLPPYLEYKQSFNAHMNVLIVSWRVVTHGGGVTSGKPAMTIHTS